MVWVAIPACQDALPPTDSATSALVGTVVGFAVGARVYPHDRMNPV